MRFSLVALMAICALAQNPCPVADGLYYKGRSGYYQVQCGVEYWTKTNLESSSISSGIACAE